MSFFILISPCSITRSGRTKGTDLFGASCNDAANCSVCTASAVDQRMCMEHWRNDTSRRKPKHVERNLPRCYFAYTKSHVHWPGIEPYPSQETPVKNSLGEGTVQIAEPLDTKCDCTYSSRCVFRCWFCSSVRNTHKFVVTFKTRTGRYFNNKIV